MFLAIEFGEYKCSSTNGTNAEFICAIADGNGSQAMPPVVITVDFGDGSGEQKWSRDDTRDLWVHQYTLPGNYFVTITSEIRQNTK